MRSITPEIFSPPVFACLCSRDLNMALKRMAHYKPLVGPLRLEVEQNERRTVVAIRGLPETTPPPQSLIAFELAFWVQVARMATRERIVPAGRLPSCWVMRSPTRFTEPFAPGPGKPLSMLARAATPRHPSGDRCRDYRTVLALMTSTRRLALSYTHSSWLLLSSG